MREVGCVGSPPHVTRLKVERNDLRSVIRRTPADQAGELQLEYAEKCEDLGHWYRQQGCETPAKCEFGEAAQARRNAASNCHNIR